MIQSSLEPVVAFVTQMLMTAARLSHVGELPGLLTKIPHPVLISGHCLAIAGMTKQSYSGRLMSYVLGLLLAFGGNLMSNYFLGTQASSVLFTSNQAVLIWTVSWWLVNHNPISLVDDLFDLQAVGIFARACVHILRALTISAQVNAAAAAYPGVIAPALIAGTLSGCGGRLLCDAFESVSGIKGKFELAHPGFLLRSSVVNSGLVYVLVHVLKAFTVLEATGLLLVISLLYSLTDDLAIKAVDATEHLTNVFAMVTLVAPKAAAPRGRSTTAAAAVKATPRKRSASTKRRSTTPSRK
jgi:hypothetical protein